MSSTDPFQQPQAAPQPPAPQDSVPQSQAPQAQAPQAQAPQNPYAYPQHPYPPQPYGQHPYGPPRPAQPAPRRGWKPMVLSGLAGAVAGAVLSAGIAVPATLVLAGDDTSVSSTVQGTDSDTSTDDSTTDDSTTDGSTTDPALPGDGFGYDDGSAPGSTSSSTGVDASEEQSEGVVLVESTMQGGSGAGTGMVLSSDGLVLTNYHVVEDSTDVQVTIAVDGTTYDAELVGADETADVALLQLEDASGLDTVTLDDDGDATVGAAVTAIGNAQGQGYLSAMSGAVTALEQEITTSDGVGFGASDAELTGLVQTDAAVVSGYSGGPMLDEEGEVVGITTAASTNAAQSYAVPIEDALAIVDQIEDGDESGTVRIGPGAYLGIGAQSTTGGVGVAEVEAGGAAAKAGLVAGDTITTLGGSSVASLSELTGTLATYEPGEQVKIGWTTAAGATRSATVTLGESPVN